MFILALKNRVIYKARLDLAANGQDCAEHHVHCKRELIYMMKLNHSLVKTFYLFGFLAIIGNYSALARKPNPTQRYFELKKAPTNNLADQQGKASRLAQKEHQKALRALGNTVKNGQPHDAQLDAAQRVVIWNRRMRNQPKLQGDELREAAQNHLDRFLQSPSRH